MGRPRELTEEERAELLSRGLRPFEIWLPDVNSAEFWKQMAEDCRLIRDANSRENMDEVLDAFARDVWDDLD